MGSRCRIAAFVAGLVVTVVHAAAAQRESDAPPPPSPKPSEKLVYADFEGVEDGKAVSARGGAVRISSYQESDMQRTTIKGAPDGETRRSGAHQAGPFRPPRKFDSAFKARTSGPAWLKC